MSWGGESFAKMGYKAAVKVFKQWKILRGDKVGRRFCGGFVLCEHVAVLVQVLEG